MSAGYNTKFESTTTARTNGFPRRKKFHGPEKGRFRSRWWFKLPSTCSCCCLTSKPVQGATLPLQCVDHVHSGDGLPLGVFGVGDCVSDYILQKHFEDATGLLVDETGDTLDSTTASQSSNCRLGDALDVVTENFPVSLGATFSQAFASFTTTSHVD